MKQLFSLSFLLLSILCVCQAQEVSVMTFNLRVASANDAPNHWKARKAGVVYCLESEAPMLLGVQEAEYTQIKFLDGTLSDYEREGVSRDGKKRSGEFSAIYYNTNYFERLDGGTFWLSETPEKVSKGWDASRRRIVTWVKLEDKRSGEQLCYFNTHLDHVGTVARQNSSTLICEKINEIAGELPAIVSGDFNALEDEDPVVYILKSGKLQDSRKAALEVIGEENTFNAFEDKAGGVIDYIFMTKDIKVTSSEIISYKHNGIFLSDHNPIIVKAEL
ncbi:MAG: endonuclease/exonuclease/phosphatase family protein [Rikenellaceae bacterium]